MGTAFDAWYPGYIDYAPNFKNIAAFWTETALYQYATPHEYTLQDFPQNMRDLRPQSLYASPWAPGWWRLRDAVEYMETASLSVLEFAAEVQRFAAAQSLQGWPRSDRARRQTGAVRVLHPTRAARSGCCRRAPPPPRLRRRARVSATADATLNGDTRHPFTAGTWVVPTDQEFAAMVREVLDVQQYPDLRQYPGGPPERPYDAAAWTFRCKWVFASCRRMYRFPRRCGDR
jgi:hypothetical protein